MWLVANCKNGVSSHEIAHDLKVKQTTVWFMLYSIRYATHPGKLSGKVESDETFISAAVKSALWLS